MDENEQQDLMNQSMIQGQLGQNQQAQAQQQYYMQEQEKGIVDVQLEVETIKTDINHLIRQDVLIIDKETGTPDWVELKNPENRTLTDWGVDRIMQVIHFYVNKNTLLSNFSEDQINTLMLRFVCELNDLVLLKYQVLFRQISFEECKRILMNRVKTKREMKMFTMEILGKEVNEKEIQRELLEEVEKTIYKEMEKIREEQRKEKLRDYGLLMAQLETIIFATLNRAWKGEERGSIRRHTTISELIGGRPPGQKKGGMFSWGKG